MRISDWSSDVCSSDLFARSGPHQFLKPVLRYPARRYRLFGIFVSQMIQREGDVLHQPGRFRDGLWRIGKQTCHFGGRLQLRSEERRVGKECFSTFSSRGSPSHKKKNRKKEKRQ